MTKLKKRKIYKLEELSRKDLALLKKAYNVKPPTFVCFGVNYIHLNALGLVDDENNITLAGRNLVWAVMTKEAQ